MAQPAPDSLETRIARWRETGDGADGVFRDVGLLIESRRRYLTNLFGPLVADEVVDDGLQKIWAAIEAGHFDPAQAFSPWLTTVLKNSCRDLGRKTTRRATLFTDIEYNDRVPDFEDTATDALVLDSHENRRLIPDELEQILDPESRLIFAVASGIADYLDRSVLDRWCRQCDPQLALCDVMPGLLDGPLYGRLVKLAVAFQLRPDTTRKRYERVSGKVAEKTTIIALRKLIIVGRRKPPS
jgi:DNA-directed RNA polymerase specialized sigma24 family protein